MNIGEGTAEQQLVDAGHTSLPLKDLLAKILDQTVWGDYLFNFRYVSYCGSDGSIVGTNNAGSYNEGRWEADYDANLFNVAFNQRWVPASLRAYEIDGTLHFFNQNTGMWHMNMEKFVPGKQALEID